MAAACVAVIDDQVFDQLFAGLVTTNDEGRPVGMHGRRVIQRANMAAPPLGDRLMLVSLIRVVAGRKAYPGLSEQIPQQRHHVSQITEHLHA
jgi:hypothetical protein